MFVETTYTIGSEHKCRVVDTRMTDRTIVVATRKDILKQKIVSHKVCFYNLTFLFCSVFCSLIRILQ